jgi:hypothetical protein
MNKVIFPFTLFVVAVGLFFSYTDPALDAVDALKIQEERIKKVLASTQQLEEQQGVLVGKVAGISRKDRDRLETMILPDNIDVVRYIIHLDALAGKSGLLIRSFSFPKISDSASKPSSAEQKVGEALFTVDAVGTYTAFKNFLTQIEKSAVLTDIISLRVDVPPQIIVPGEQLKVSTVDSQVYTLGLKTYWLY